jgi:histidinol-phosphate/aromatic aminotransferase/cobyric acid decarboxylase-like protein
VADHDAPRAAVTPPRVHGGPDGVRLRSLGIDPAQVIDFSVNVNPYGPAPAMRAAIQSARVDVYPDSAAHAARVALGVACGVTPERIVLGNGGADLLWTLARLLLSPRHTLLMVEPTFSELRAAAVTVGARVVEWRASRHDDFRIDLAAIVAAARTQRADVIYLCAPNNPTGAPVRAHDVAALADALPAVTIVLDQAFLSLSAHAADAALDLPASVVRVRSLTKEHAIPGVRVGYLIATPALAARVESARPAWTTGAAAQAAAIASCALGGFVDDSCARMLADRRALASGLGELGLRAVPTDATYLMVDVGARGDGTRIAEALLVEHRILVRDCASFGLPGYIRLAARPADDRARLLAALAATGKERDE